MTRELSSSIFEMSQAREKKILENMDELQVVQNLTIMSSKETGDKKVPEPLS